MARPVFEERLEDLNKTLLNMGFLVQEAIYKAVKSLTDKNTRLAQEVLQDDEKINALEVEIEKKCFELIALQQPVGKDLRRIATMLKVSTDLERMGDHAVSISKTTIRLEKEPYAKPLIDIPKMADIVKEMVQEVLEAFVNQDQEKAVQVSKKDDQIDELFGNIFMEVSELMQKNPEMIRQGPYFLLVAQNLERIGDYVTNMCEWIVYLQTAKLVDLN
ncbi:MAG: phosphate transport system regulatory protein PhoU [Caldibacillus debilis]|uniref:Phosphate-specific transport system accessory protein PhoU n=1 Tax=Caldibacillus debilis TaxID=301148 RepID=A0A3E0K4I0_9BACI|nr:phosphate signaling complex protein PhoU [Caldibacillus debilis]REJ13985.1 MAG: phosphate transport system regulatory protein PhoU [Caldibacillus debilis]REJ28600.1 MAG: phosphate transport system regulatory protein PhoU [Caldibacillus debilis]